MYFIWNYGIINEESPQPVHLSLCWGLKGAETSSVQQWRFLSDYADVQAGQFSLSAYHKA